MPNIFLLSIESNLKTAKQIKKKIQKDGVKCQIINTPDKAVKKVKESFGYSYKYIPKLPSKKISDYKIDPEKYSFSSKDYSVTLRKKEYELLQFFISNKNKIINRNTILDNVWGPSCNPFTNTVDVHVASLRRKLPKDKKLLKTIHGVGYKFEV